MFRKAKNIGVFGGTFIMNEVHEAQNVDGRQILLQSPYVVLGAIHDSSQRYPPPQCHPGTREEIQNTILSWVDTSLEESESQIFWLHGPAGVGKTAIAQTLCQRLKLLGRHGGDFFLSRSVVGHDDLHTLFPTLAYQLAHAYPEFGLELDTIIKTDVSILTKNVEVQLEQLIVSPLKRVKNKLDTPLVLVIDGLDEARKGEKDQTSFLRLLGSSFLSHRLPLKIILTSRPEPWIKNVFEDNPLLGSARPYFLHHTSQTDRDIRTFLKSNFTEIRRTHDLMKSQPDSWPSSEVIDDIVDGASGQFIYASTILRYIEDPNGNPIERLQWVMKTPSTGYHDIVDSPFLALDNLYKHVLSTSSNMDHTLAMLGAAISFITTKISMSESRRRSLTSTLALINSIINEMPEVASVSYGNTTEIDRFPIDRMERLLNFRGGDGSLAIRTIQSLVYISSGGKGGINFYHKSFQDFLLDPNRSGKYFVEMNQIHSKLMMGAIGLLRSSAQSDTTSWSSYTKEDLQIITSRWVKWWLRSAASDEERLLTDIRAVDQATFYRYYAGNIARKMSFLLFKTYPEKIVSLVESHRNGGNIAESISREISRYRTGAFSLALEKFLAVEAVFGEHLNKALPDPSNTGRR